LIDFWLAINLLCSQFNYGAVVTAQQPFNTRWHMWNKLKDSFNRSSYGARAFILYFYFSAMAFFMVVWMFGFDLFELGVVIGLLSAIVIEPLLQTSEKGNKAKEFAFKFIFARKVIFSLIICFSLIAIRHLINQVFGGFDFEPISFGLLFAGVHALFSYFMNFLFRLKGAGYEK